MNSWVKDVEINKRKFRLTFSEDTVCKGLYHCLGEEIYHDKKHLLDFGWKDQVFEFYTADEDIIDIAFTKINSLFDSEKTNKIIKDKLDTFINSVN